MSSFIDEFYDSMIEEAEEELMGSDYLEEKCKSESKCGEGSTCEEDEDLMDDSETDEDIAMFGDM